MAKSRHIRKRKKHSGKIINCVNSTQHLILSHEVDTRFQSIEDWLLFLSGNDHPDTTITEFRFDLARNETQHYLLTLYGVKTHYNMATHTHYSKIIFVPQTPRFFFSNTLFTNQNFTETGDDISRMITACLSNPAIRNGLFADAKSIALSWLGEEIKF